MEGRRFDALVRSLSTRQNRRGLVGGLLAGLAGGLATGHSPVAARCTTTCPPGQVLSAGCRCVCRLTGRPPVNGGCPCLAGQTACDDGLCRHGVDCNAPTCTETGGAFGPPATLQVTIQDTGSGLAEILVTQSVNTDTVVPPFTVGTHDPVVVSSTKIDQTQPATFEMRLTDLAGNVRICTHVLPSDSQPPVCPITLNDAGPPARIEMTFQDTDSGLAEILVTKSENADTVVPPFTVGTHDPVVLSSTKIDQTKTASIEVRVTDLAGNQETCTATF